MLCVFPSPASSLPLHELYSNVAALQFLHYRWWTKPQQLSQNCSYPDSGCWGWAGLGVGAILQAAVCPVLGTISTAAWVATLIWGSWAARPWVWASPWDPGKHRLHQLLLRWSLVMMFPAASFNFPGPAQETKGFLSPGARDGGDVKLFWWHGSVSRSREGLALRLGWWFALGKETNGPGWLNGGLFALKQGISKLVCAEVRELGKALRLGRRPGLARMRVKEIINP